MKLRIDRVFFAPSCHQSLRISKEGRGDDLVFLFRSIPFLVGFLATLKFSIGGEFYLGEILAVGYLLANYRRLLIGKPLRPILILAFIWAGCQAISDLGNGTAWLDSLKGVGAPLVFALTISALAMFWSRDIRRMPSFLLGAHIGMIPIFLLAPDAYFQGNPWKWGVGQIVLGIFVIFFSFFSRKRGSLSLLCFLLLFLLGGLLNDARSMAVFPLIAGGLYFAVRTGKFDSLLMRFQGRYGVIKLAMVTIALVLGMNSAFTAAFSSPWLLQFLPQASADKFRMQANGNYGVLLGGRNEILVSVGAFLEKPWFGHGSWAKDDGTYRDLLAARMFEAGYSDNPLPTSEMDLIPVHSYLMGGLVWAGIGGGVFWVYLMNWSMRIFMAHVKQFGFYFYSGLILFMWNVFFSPFGASARWATALFIAALFVYARQLTILRRAQ